MLLGRSLFSLGADRALTFLSWGRRTDCAISNAGVVVHDAAAAADDDDDADAAADAAAADDAADAATAVLLLLMMMLLPKVSLFSAYCARAWCVFGFLFVCARGCVCVCVCARALVCVCVCVWVGGWLCVCVLRSSPKCRRW